MTHDFVDLWAVHSSVEDRPVFRDWARTEAQAQAKLEQLRATDGENSAAKYWVTRLTRAEFAGLKKIGLLPTDA